MKTIDLTKKPYINLNKKAGNGNVICSADWKIIKSRLNLSK